MHKELLSGGGPLNIKKKTRKIDNPDNLKLPSQKMKDELIQQNLYDSHERNKKYEKEFSGSGSNKIDERAVQITQLKFSDVENTMQQ